MCLFFYCWYFLYRFDSKLKKLEFKILFKLWNIILFLECGNFCIYLFIFELLFRWILNFWIIDINWIVFVDEFYCFLMSWIVLKFVIVKVFYLILLMECIFILVYYFYKIVWYYLYFLVLYVEIKCDIIRYKELNKWNFIKIFEKLKCFF